MTDGPGGSARTMRDTFTIWNLDATEREVVLRSSDDQHVAVPLPEADAEAFERLAGSSGTVEATLVATDDGSTSWRVREIHAVGDGA